MQAHRVIGAVRTALLAVAVLAGCDLGDALPPTPAQTAAADGRALEGRLREQLDALPGLERAAVAIAVPPRDPLAPRRPARARVAVTLVVGTDADRDGLRVAATAAATALVGAETDLTVTVLAAPPRRPRPRRAAAIAAAIAIAAAATALALALVRRRYRGTRPQ